MAKIAFLFPGQGTQYVGMGKELYEKSEIARKYFDAVFSLNPELKEVMFEGPEEKLKETKYTQPAIVLVSLVLNEILKEKGLNPDYVAGHSLGEYTALGAAEVLTTEEAVSLATVRGKIMSEVASDVNGTMAAILGLESKKIEDICVTVEGTVEAVNYNEPLQTVIAGEKEAVEKACLKLSENGAKRTIMLAVSGPFHSSLMKPAADLLKKEFEKLNFKIPKCPIIANTDAEIKNSIEEIKNELYKQTFGPVKWVDTINKLKDKGIEKIYEIGPGKVLKGLVKKIDKEMTVENIESLEDIEKISI